MYKWSIFLCLLVFSCNTASENNQIKHYDEQFHIDILDTVKVSIIGKNVKAIDFDYLNKRILYCDVAKIDTIYITNYEGMLLSKLSIPKEGENGIGNVIHNVGFTHNSNIIINSNRGFFTINKDGKIIHIVKEKTNILTYGAGIIPRIRTYFVGQNLFAVLHLKSSFDGNLLSQKGYKEYKPITVYDLKSGKFSFTGGYDENSLFVKDEIHFGEPLNLFDVDDKGNIYTINSPESIVYVYNINNPEKKKQLFNIFPENFKQNLKFSFSGKITPDSKEQIVNGQFIDINCSNDTILLTYRTGISEDIVSQVRSSSEYPEIFKKHMKYFAIFLVKGQKVCHDIEMPFGGTNIAFIDNNGLLFINTNRLMNEKDDCTIFYRCRLTLNKE